MSDGYVAEHRKVVHDAGIPIGDADHVHHVNGDKADNRLANLVVMKKGDHHRHHVSPGSTVTNQHGTFRVLTPEQRREKNIERMRRWRETNREHVRDYKRRRRLS